MTARCRERQSEHCLAAACLAHKTHKSVASLVDLTALRPRSQVSRVLPLGTLQSCSRCQSNTLSQHTPPNNINVAAKCHSEWRTDSHTIITDISV